MLYTLQDAEGGAGGGRGEADTSMAGLGHILLFSALPSTTLSKAGEHTDLPLTFEKF